MNLSMPLSTHLKWGCPILSALLPKGGKPRISTRHSQLTSNGGAQRFAFFPANGWETTNLNAPLSNSPKNGVPRGLAFETRESTI
jgi:hypothetical protein